MNLTKEKLCSFCGAKLLGRKVRFKCSTCGQFNLPPATLTPQKGKEIDDGTILLHEVPDYDVPRLKTGPWDSNFGDPPGVPEDSVTIVGGEPGAGKSTIALQLSDAMALTSKKEVLYLCAEEGKKQIKSRYSRLGARSRRVRIVPLENMHSLDLEKILVNHSLAGVVLDSIAAFTNDPLEAVDIVLRFKALADQYRVPFIVINHVTKDGAMAGMMKLQHAGDISLLLTKGEKDVVERVCFKAMQLSEEVGKGIEERDERGEERFEERFEENEEDYEEDIEDGDQYFEITEVRELYTDKSRYGPSGITSRYAMTERGLIEVELEPELENI